MYVYCSGGTSSGGVLGRQKGSFICTGCIYINIAMAMPINKRTVCSSGYLAAVRPSLLRILCGQLQCAFTPVVYLGSTRLPASHYDSIRGGHPRRRRRRRGCKIKIELFVA